MRKILITSALPYANGNLHLGHILGLVQADVYTRYHKLIGNQCWHISGADCHGAPILLKAKQDKKLASGLAGSYRDAHSQTLKRFSVELDLYADTLSEEHASLARAIYSNLRANNLIYERTRQLLVDSSLNLWLADRFVKGNCPVCQQPNQNGDGCSVCGAVYDATSLLNPKSVLSNTTPTPRDCRCIFFKTTSLAEDLKSALKSTLPLAQQKYISKWINCLEDWDISREEPYFGIPITPGSSKYFYVWFDACIGYLSFTQQLFKQQQPWQQGSDFEIYQYIGKDIVYFHALFWNAILIANHYRLPNQYIINGFITCDRGKKLSKSQNNASTIAEQLLNQVNTDAVRFYLAYHSQGNDASLKINQADAERIINNLLINKILNLTSRTDGFWQKTGSRQLVTKFNLIDFSACADAIHKTREQVFNYYESRNFKGVILAIEELANQANRTINNYEIWKIDDARLLKEACTLVLLMVYAMVSLVEPITPNLTAEVMNYLGVSGSSLLKEPYTLPYGSKLNKIKPFLTKI